MSHYLFDDLPNKRIYLRTSVKLLLKVKTTGGLRSVTTETKDLSRGGLSLYMDWKLPIGHVIKISFVFGRKKFPVKAKVIYSYEDPARWHFVTGVSFLDPKGNKYADLTDTLVKFIGSGSPNSY